MVKKGLIYLVAVLFVFSMGAMVFAVKPRAQSPKWEMAVRLSV